MTDYTLKRNDTRPIVELHLTENGVPLNLTGASSVKLLMKAGATTVSRAGSIFDAINGIVRVTLTAPDTATSGTYQAEVEITWAAGQIETVPNDGYMSVVILDDLG